LYESVKFDECVRAACRGKVLLRRVGGCEFAGQVGEIREGEFLWIRGVANAEEDEVILYDVASGVSVYERRRREEEAD
jgi:hypothetical protein